jgi:hypothetical protein
MTEDAGQKSPISECHGADMRATQYPLRSTCAQKLVNTGYWIARSSRAMTGPA